MAISTSRWKQEGKRRFTAEKIAKDNGKKKLLVISGIGVKEYYRKLEYEDDGVYVSKYLQNP